MPESTHQLFGLGPAGPEPLPLPANLANPAHVFDDLPGGIYEALRTFDHNRFVGLEAHLDRAVRSMGHFGITPPLKHQALRAALHEIATDFPGQDGKIRMDFLSEPARSLGTNAVVVVMISELELPSPEVYSGGVQCLLLDHLRRDRPEIKTARWVVDRRSAEGGTPENYESILVSPSGELLEGVMSNLFVVRDGVLHTAPVSGVLPGVTRGIVLMLAERLHLPWQERPVGRHELGHIQEAFFSTSVRSLVPVVRIEGTEIGSGRPGPITRSLVDAYGRYCQDEARPASVDP